jgi:hypothetical protein
MVIHSSLDDADETIPKHLLLKTTEGGWCWPEWKLLVDYPGDRYAVATVGLKIGIKENLIQLGSRKS